MPLPITPFDVGLDVPLVVLAQFGGRGAAQAHWTGSIPELPADSAALHTFRGCVALLRGEYGAATEEFSEAAALEPADAAHQANLSAALLGMAREEDFEAALAAAETAISLAPAWPKGWLRKAAALRSLFAFAEAEEVLLHAERVACASVDAAGASATAVERGDEGVEADPADLAAASAAGYLAGPGAGRTVGAGQAALGSADVAAPASADGAAALLAASAALTGGVGAGALSLRPSASYAAEVSDALHECRMASRTEPSRPRAAGKVDRVTREAAARGGAAASGAPATSTEGAASAAGGGDGSSMLSATVDSSTGAADDSAAEGDDDEAAFAGLEEWLAGGSAFPHIYMRRYGEGNRGVHARCDIPGEGEVMAVGERFLITVEVAKACAWGRKLAAARIDGQLSANKHCYLAVFLLWDRARGDASPFAPYYRILPRAYPSMPIFWPPEELELLRGSFLLQQVADRKRNLAADYELVGAAVPEFKAAFSLHDFLWARMVVASRNFGIAVDGVRTDALVPLADMLNHHRPRQTRWFFDSRRRAFLIIAMHRLLAGQQVYDSYGKKCNSRFLLNYGFCVDRNVDDDTGQCHNEVRFMLALPPPHEDPWHHARRELLGSCAPSRAVRMSTFGAYEGTQEGFSFLRFAFAHGDELRALPHLGEEYDRDLGTEPIPPISAANEARVLWEMARLSAAQLALYPTTLEQDGALLAAGSVPFFTNRRNALVLLRGEKEVCAFYTRLADEAVPLLTAKDPEAARAALLTRYSSGSHSDLTRYLLGTVAPLLKKRADAEAAARAAAFSRGGSGGDAASPIAELASLMRSLGMPGEGSS